MKCLPNHHQGRPKPPGIVGTRAEKLNCVFVRKASAGEAKKPLFSHTLKAAARHRSYPRQPVEKGHKKTKEHSQEEVFSCPLWLNHKQIPLCAFSTESPIVSPSAYQQAFWEYRRLERRILHSLSMGENHASWSCHEGLFMGSQFVLKNIDGQVHLHVHGSQALARAMLEEGQTELANRLQRKNWQLRDIHFG